MEFERCVDPDVFFGECATSKEALEKLKMYWEQISGMYPGHLQAYIRSLEWLVLLGVFVERSGVGCCDDYILRCCRMVHDERPVLKEQMKEKYRDVTGIRKHRE